MEPPQIQKLNNMRDGKNILSKSSTETEIKHDFRNDDIFELGIKTEPVTSTEIQKAIKNLKNGKSARIDGTGIPAELLKAGGDVAVEQLRALCNRYGRQRKSLLYGKTASSFHLLRKET